MKKFIIVGSGRQGISVAYDLLRDSNHHVVMVDVNENFLNQALNKISAISNSQNLNLAILTR